MARWKRNEKLGKKRDDFSENACYTGSVQKVNEAGREPVLHRKHIGSFFLQYKTTHTLLVSLTAGKDRQHAGVAQLVERLHCKRRVAGSNPAASSNDICHGILNLLSAGRSNRGGFAV